MMLNFILIFFQTSVVPCCYRLLVGCQQGNGPLQTGVASIIQEEVVDMPHCDTGGCVGGLWSCAQSQESQQRHQ